MKKLGLVSIGIALFFMSSIAQETGDQKDVQKQDKTKMDQTDMHKKDKTQKTGTYQTDQAMQSDKPEKFIHTIALDRMYDEKLGELAQQKASDQEVRELGRQISENSSSAKQDFEAIARDMQVEIPSELDAEREKKLEELSSKSNEEFSKAYVDIIVENYKEDISELEKAQGEYDNQRLNQWISTRLPELRQQLQTAENIQQGLGDDTDSGMDDMMRTP